MPPPWPVAAELFDGSKFAARYNLNANPFAGPVDFHYKDGKLDLRSGVTIIDDPPVFESPAPRIPKFHASSKIVENEIAIVPNPTASDWMTLGGVVTTPSFFMADLSKAIGRLIGSVKTVGAGAELRVVEINGGTTVAIGGPFSLQDTTGAWAIFQFLTSVAPRPRTNTYILQGRLNTATSASVRFVSMSLLEAPA